MTSDCLEDRTAVQFAKGQLTTEARERVIAHLDTCVACAALVAELLASDGDATARARPGAPGVSSTLLAPQDESPPPPPRDVSPPRSSGWGARADLPRLKGPYRLDSLLARGGMGEIYRATDTELSRAVAIKVPRRASADLLRRFEREVAITARLQHPGIVPVHGAGVLDNGTPFYVMPFVEGTPLDVAVALAVDRDARLALISHLVSVAETMAYVHSERIVHRDLKPNNVLLGKFGETVVIDWGLAKQLVAPMERPSREELGEAASGDATPSPAASGNTTRAGDVLGTPSFMAPEQAAGEAVDERADVYALGVMLGFIVAGTVPRASVPLDWSGAAAPFEPVYLRATSLLPGDRFPTAGAFAAALRAALAPAPVESAPPVTTRPGFHRILFAAGVLVLAIAIPVALVLRARHRSSSPGAPGARIELLDLTRTDLLAFALSPSGRRLAYGGFDRIEVRDLETDKTWTQAAWVVWPRILTWESEDELRFAGRQRLGAELNHLSWNVARDAVTSLGAVAETPPAWVGELDGGRAVYMSFNPVRPRIVGGGAAQRVVGAGKYPVNLIAIAPDRRRFAFSDLLDRVSTVIRIVDADGVTIDSPTLRDITALTWQAPDSLLYATGATGSTTLWRARPTADGLAAPTRVYDHVAVDQWIGGIGARGGRILLSIVTSRFESHWFEIASGHDQPLPRTDASAVLGWIDATTFMTWNRSSSAIEQRPIERGALSAITPVVLRGDPANATRAGSLLVIAQRDDEGRRVIAYDASGAVRWETPPGVLWFVRCAGDVAPPCIAGARTPAGLLEVRMIDAATGTLGDVVVTEANISDAALDRRGTHLAWIGGTALYTRTLADRGPGEPHPNVLGSSHSLAFVAHSLDLIVAAGTDGAGIYRVVGGTITRLHSTDGSIVSLLRASPDGTHASYRVRNLSSQLAELHGAP